MSLPKTVQRAIEKGWSVIPVRLDKRPCVPSWKEFQRRRATLEEAEAWHKKYDPPAWAVITGAISGQIIFDFDGDAGAQTLKRLGLTANVQTGSGGYHCYAAHPGCHVPTLNAKTKRELGQRWPGTDIRGDGGYAVFYGENEHGRYKWLRAPDVAPNDWRTLPEDLRRLLGLVPPSEPEKQQTPPKPEPAVAAAGNGRVAEAEWLIRQALDRARRGDGRNNSGFWLAMQCRDNGYSETEAEAIIATYAAQVPPTNTKGQRDPYTNAEVLASIRKAYERPARPPIERGYGRAQQVPPAAAMPSPAAPQAPASKDSQAPSTPEDPLPEPEPPEPALSVPFALTDLGNSERMQFRHGRNLRFCPVMKTWFVWDGRRFAADETGAIYRLAAKTARGIYDEVKHALQDDEAKALAKHALKTESARSLTNMIELTRYRAGLAIAPDDLDGDPWLLNVLNGTLDLRTGTLRRHERTDLMTKLVPAKFDANAQCPYWLEFLDLIMGGNARLVEFLQRAIGYSLTGDSSERILFFPYGTGRNGKSTFLETVHMLLGDYAMKTPSETLIQKRENGVPNDVARLKGARFVYASETAEGGRLNEEQVKNLTGEKTLIARFMRGEFFEFRRSFKLWL